METENSVVQPCSPVSIPERSTFNDRTISATLPDIKVESNPVNDELDEGTTTTEAHIVEEDIKTIKHESTDKNTKTETESKPIRKNYFSAAVDSISNIWGKYQESRASKYNDVIVDNIEEKKHLTKTKSNTAEERKLSSSLFRIFNHQTFSAHSNSIFSSFASVLHSGEVDLDQSKDNGDKVHATGLSVRTNDADLSVYPDDVHCNCPSSLTNSERKMRSSVTVGKGENHVCSDFTKNNQEIKCPLGKNCSIQHSNRRYSYPKNTCDICSSSSVTDNNNSRIDVSKKQSRSDSIISSLTHDHFDCLVHQQVISLQTDVQEGFQNCATRENEMKVYFAEQMVELKRTISSEYMGWVTNEMQLLKQKLQEKDEEIRRLRDMLTCSNHDKKETDL